MKAIVVGAGKMGMPLALGMSKQGFDVNLVEPNDQRLENAGTEIASLGGKAYLYSSLEDIEDRKCDVLVSAAPFHQNVEIFTFCMDNKIRYCDLGGDPTTGHTIHDRAKAANLVAFTDLGLAPGFVNIMAEELYRRDPGTKSLRMRVGGLPSRPSGALMYARTWSMAGLINEYTGDCEAIRDGQLALIEALTEIEELEITGRATMEAFHTKGGFASSLQSFLDKGLQHADYKTIRYPGHAKLMSFLMHECKLGHNQLVGALESACPMTREDEVIIAVMSDNTSMGYSIVHDENLTAMQKATAFPAAAVAAIVAEGQFDDKVLPTYADIPYDRMQVNLGLIGWTHEA